MNNKPKNVIGGYKIYTSVLYSHWFAVEYLEQRGAEVFRVRIPYNTRVRAMRMRDYLAGCGGVSIRPDYRVQIHLMQKGMKR